MAEQSVMEGAVEVIEKQSSTQEDRELIREGAKIVKVTTPEGYSDVGGLRVKLQDAYKNRKGELDVMCKGLSDIHKRATKRRTEVLAPYLAALSTVDKALDGFRKREQEERAAEERRIAEEMRKKAEEDALKAAQEAEDAGDTQMAEAILEEPVAPPHVKLQSEVPKVEGLRKKREIWKARVVNSRALILAIAQNKAPVYLMEPNMVALNQMARSGKNTIQVPGVQFYEEK